MKIKWLVTGAVIFFLLGWNTKDGILFFFFTVHLVTLTIGHFVSQYDQKRHANRTLETISVPDSSES